MPNLLERVANILGRTRGAYVQGVKARGDAPLTDPSAWLGGPLWGEGVAGLGARKPRSKAEMVEQFTSWVYICSRANASAVAAVPLGLYVEANTAGQKWRTVKTKAVDKAKFRYLKSKQVVRPWMTKAEDIEEITEHPFLDLMKNVNPFMNGSDLRELTSTFLDLTGEAYWYIIRNNVGVPAELWPIPAQYMTAIPGKTYKEFIVGYKYKRGRVEQTLPIEDVIAFSFPNPMNPYAGFSCVKGVADAIYINAKIDEYIESMFEYKARPGGIFTSDLTISDPALNRAREQLDAKYSGARKAGMNMMLPPGIKFTPDSLSPDEMAYIEGDKVTREEIAIAFGVPISVLVSTDVNRANAEAGDYHHAKNGILPRLRKIEEKLNEKLLPMFDEKLFCAFENPVQEDRTIVLAENTQYVAAGVLTINDVRADLGKEPVDGGDEPLINSMLAPLSQIIEEPEPAPAPIIMPPGKPKPGEEGDEGNLDTGEDGQAGKAAMLDELRRLVEVKIKDKLTGNA